MNIHPQHKEHKTAPHVATPLIADTEALKRFCNHLEKSTYITIDTEFLRDKTYWPQLCLVQLAGEDEAAAIDALAEGIDLAPLFDLLQNKSVTKVFHAARQDIEIFHYLTGKIPQPVVDTQVIAMVCGFGDAASYETLAARLAHATIDKSARFTDWSHRPLSERQLSYALSDVTYLRSVYEKLMKKVEQSDRAAWVGDEMAILTDPATYRQDPETAWQRLKVRSDKPRFLAVLRAVAAWREREAQKLNIPRNRLVKDETLVEIAAHPPRDATALSRCRGLSKGFAENKSGTGILAAVQAALDLPETECPHLPPKAEIPAGLGPIIDLLRVLLKTRCDEHHVAQKLVANSSDLEQIAANDAADVPALNGWRRAIFGEEALALKHGKIGLTVRHKKVHAFPL